jgi:hypothetical protein
MNGIGKEDYLKSLGTESIGSLIKGENFFKGLGSAGKSGSFFFTSADNRFFVKTIPDREFVVAVEILEVYLHFLNSRQDDNGRTQTFISK